MQTSILQLQLMGITFLINEERWLEHDIDPVSTIQPGKKGFIKDKGWEKKPRWDQKHVAEDNDPSNLKSIHIFLFSSIFLFSFLSSFSFFLSIFSFIHSSLFILIFPPHARITKKLGLKNSSILILKFSLFLLFIRSSEQLSSLKKVK